jgi:hypothetical protein
MSSSNPQPDDRLFTGEGTPEFLEKGRQMITETLNAVPINDFLGFTGLLAVKVKDEDGNDTFMIKAIGCGPKEALGKMAQWLAAHLEEELESTPETHIH